MGKNRWHQLALCTVIVFAVDTAVCADRVDFNRDIRPILSDKCFQCHGPDEGTLKADLRLDQRESATAENAILPGKATESELIARILTDDSDDVMPPPKVKKPITSEEADLLRRWINEGAEYAGHWAFDPIKAQSLPPIENKVRVKNEIDHYVIATLEENGMTLSPEATPNTLVRRLSLDLTGLLPTPDRVKSFVADFQDDSDGTVSRYVDELLASKHYGERWGRHWLDQARYADSNGYTIDGERTMWPYRDWVIQAINDDKPFDQFTIEQIAGDLLKNPDKATLVATGFHRNTLINQEGGTDNEQFRNEEMVDRVNTTGAVWLGLTLGCAQCHTHKFDPISQKEYFEVFAFFNQGEDVNNVATTIEVGEGEMFLKNPDPEKITALESAKATLASVTKSTSKRQMEWEASKIEEKQPNSKANWIRRKPSRFSADDGAHLELLEDDSILASKDGANEIYRVEIPASSASVAAMRLRILPHDSLPQNGPGLAGNGNIVLTRVEFFHNGKPIMVKQAEHDHAQPGFSGSFTIDGNPNTGWAINVGKGTAPGVKMNTEHEIRFSFAKAIPAGEAIEIVLHHEKNPHYNIGRFAWESSETPPPPVYDERLIAGLLVPPKERSKEQKSFLTTEFEKADVEKRAAVLQLEEARDDLGIGKPVRTMVMKDRATPRETYIHERGDFLRPDKATGTLSPGVPAVLPALPKLAAGKERRDRLDLAQWLVRGDHPLTPRVTVNRVWMRYFGKGIVETENDFGTQSSYPTHPELLDWLAKSFVDKGWSIKNLHKMIVTSATYRQSSHRDQSSEADPLNHLLGRQSRIRVEAEIIRDIALSASGLLSPKLGGPGVMPPQPAGVYAFTQRKVNWAAEKGPDRFRRGLYTKFYRSAPYPLLTTFDSPDFQSVCTGRVRSNTPLQSLTLANDKAMMELAKGLAARLLTEVSGTDSNSNRDRVRLAFLLTVSRPPSEKELEAVTAYQEKQLADFSGDENGAKAFAPDLYPPSYDTHTAAAWSAVARALMNTDEFITRE